MVDSNKTIAICIPTYLRPQLLVSCLRSIEQIKVPEDHRIIIIVVDNDTEKSARNIFKQVTGDFPHACYYCVEPERGLSMVRNRLIETAIQNQADYIAFIDDDELAHRDWLQNMLLVMNKHAADIVAGPALPVLDGKIPDNFQPSGKYPTGSTPRHIATSNVMFNIRLAKDLGLRFDPYFNFSGGEDFDFFDRARDQGASAVWASDAPVFEIVTEERSSRQYLMYRHFSGGINAVMRHKRRTSSLSAWLHLLPKAIGKMIDAFFCLVLSLITFNNKYLEKAIIRFSNGLGYLCGLFNIVVERYRYSNPEKPSL